MSRFRRTPYELRRTLATVSTHLGICSGFQDQSLIKSTHDAETLPVGTILVFIETEI